LVRNGNNGKDLGAKVMATKASASAVAHPNHIRFQIPQGGKNEPFNSFYVNSNSRNCYIGCFRMRCPENHGSSNQRSYILPDQRTFILPDQRTFILPDCRGTGNARNKWMETDDIQLQQCRDHIRPG